MATPVTSANSTATKPVTVLTLDSSNAEYTTLKQQYDAVLQYGIGQGFRCTQTDTTRVSYNRQGYEYAVVTHKYVIEGKVDMEALNLT